jgi:carbon storage regulator CsrA
MLVLARQLHERIVMPSVPATIEVVAIKPNAVRLGIAAPEEVTILREEVLRRGSAAPAELLRAAEPDADARLGRVKHVLRNRLQTLALALDLLRQHLPEETAPGLPAMTGRMTDEIRALDQQLRAVLAEKPRSLSGQPAECCELAEDGLAI